MFPLVCHFLLPVAPVEEHVDAAAALNSITFIVMLHLITNRKAYWIGIDPAIC